MPHDIGSAPEPSRDEVAAAFGSDVADSYAQIRSKQMFEIEKDIPIPPLKGNRKETLYPFNQMEVGDSFFVPFGEDEKLTKMRVSASIGQRCRHYKKNGQPNRFSMRSVGTGVRVWRVR